MAEYETSHHNYSTESDTALQTINTIIIQLHFEKTLEKKRAIDQQKKGAMEALPPLLRLLGLATQVHSPCLKCLHSWIPTGLLSLSHLILYVLVAQTLRSINGFKYQRRCHKLTLRLATEWLRQMSTVNASVGGEDVMVMSLRYIIRNHPRVTLVSLRGIGL